MRCSTRLGLKGADWIIRRSIYAWMFWITDLASKKLMHDFDFRFGTSDGRLSASNTKGKPIKIYELISLKIRTFHRRYS